MTAALALIKAQWQQRWNKQWRFSRAKAGLWILLLQLGFGAAAIWRLRPAATGLTLAGAAALILLQAASWSFLSAFLSGRTKLYGTRTLALVHASSAPPLSVLLAAAGDGVLRRVWSMLLWAGALGLAVGPLAVPLLWLLGIAAGTLGHLAGLLALIAWVRLAPRLLGAAWVGVLVLQVAILWYAIYQIAAGPGDLAALQTALRGPLVGGMAALFGLPGLLMLLWLGAAPGRLGQAYRDGWLRLAELGDGSSRPRRSRWPQALPGPAGAVWAKEWLLMGRNPATWFRLGALLLLATALIPARPALLRLAAAHHDLVVLGTGLGAVFFCFGELIAAGFSAEGHRIGLLVISGTSSLRLLAGKVLSLTPYVLLGAAATLAVSVAVGDLSLALAATAFAISLGAAAIAAAGAAWDARVVHDADDHDSAALSALLEQIPRGFGGNAGMLLSALWTGGSVWAAALDLPQLWLLLTPFPALVLLLGWWRLRDQLAGGNIR